MLTFSFTRYTLLTDLCTYLTDWFLIFLLYSAKSQRQLRSSYQNREKRQRLSPERLL